MLDDVASLRPFEERIPRSLHMWHTAPFSRRLGESAAAARFVIYTTWFFLLQGNLDAGCVFGPCGKLFSEKMGFWMSVILVSHTSFPGPFSNWYRNRTKHKKKRQSKQRRHKGRDVFIEVPKLSSSRRCHPHLRRLLSRRRPLTCCRCRWPRRPCRCRGQR